MSVTEAMRFRIGVNVPAIAPQTTIREAYAQATAMAAASGLRTAGALLVVDAQGLLGGIFTDGDLRRLVLKQAQGGPTPVGEVPIGQAMTRNPGACRPAPWCATRCRWSASTASTRCRWWMRRGGRWG